MGPLHEMMNIMKKLAIILVLMSFLCGCTPGNGDPSPTLPIAGTTSTTPSTVLSPSPISVEVPTPSPAPTSTRDPLDFTDLPENQRPVLTCIPVTAEEQVNTWPFVDDATGWRIEMGVGNDSSETWS